MEKISANRIVGWSLILSVAAWIVQLAAVSLLYATWVEFFGGLSDFSNALTVLFMLPLLAALQRSNRAANRWTSLLASVIGTAGILAVAGAGLALIARMINFEQSLPPNLAGYCLIGVWLLISLGLARRQGSLPGKVTGLGMLVGLGLAATGLLVGSLNAGVLEGGDFTAFWSNPLVYPALVLVPIGYFGYPLWAYWFGRRLLRGATGFESRPVRQPETSPAGPAAGTPVGE